jgi:hypothetical protein
MSFGGRNRQRAYLPLRWSAVGWTDSADALRESLETRPPMESLIASSRRALESGEAHPRNHPIYPEASTTLKNALARLLSAHAANRGWNLFYRELQQ